MMNRDANKNYLLESAAEEVLWQWQYKHFLAFEYRLVYQMMVTRDSKQMVMHLARVQGQQMDSMMVMHLARVQVPQMDSMMVMHFACLSAYLC